MVRIDEQGNVFVKLLYWGCARSGKTTAVDTLFRLTKEKFKDTFEPTGILKKLAMKNGATLYYDRGVFHSKKQNKIFYHVYTVAGQIRFAPLRKRIFAGTDGVIFMFDGQRSRLVDNIESLKELKNVSKNRLIAEIPFLVQVNKQDLPNTFKKKEIEEILKKENLFYGPTHDLQSWNPIIYESVALYDKASNIYQVYSELARRTALYQAGFGPSSSQKYQPTEKVPEL